MKKIIYNKMKDYYRRFRRVKVCKNVSFSQSGEDVIVWYIFQSRGILRPTYLDIGANDPFNISNTALMYKSGCRGVCVEANPLLCTRFAKKRKRDIVLNAGIVGCDTHDTEMLFYVMDPDTMSTFDKRQAEELQNKYDYKIMKKIPISLITIPDIVSKYCDGEFPDFLALDAEGMDFSILKSIDYSNNRGPKVICVETIEFSDDALGRKDHEIENYLIENGYFKYADTYINSIFIRRDFLKIDKHVDKSRRNK